MRRLLPAARFAPPFLAVCALLVTTSAGRPFLLAATPESGVRAPEAALFIEGATVVDGTGGAPRVANVAVVKGTITGVGADVKAPPGARTIDGRGRFVLPGLIDAHSHLDFPIVFQVTPEEKDAIVANTPRAFLYNGVTTVLNVSSPAEWIWKMRDDQRNGRLLGPRIYATGKGFTPEGGWGSRHGDTLRTTEDARARVRDYAAHKADGVKIIIEDGLGHSGTFKEMTPEMLEGIAIEARKARLPMFVHAINLTEFKRAVGITPRAIVHGLEDPLPPGDSLLKDLVARKIAVVPTISLFEAFNRLDGKPEAFDDPVLKGSIPTFLWERMRTPEYMKVEKERFQAVAGKEVYAWAARAVPIFKENTKKMSDAGVKIGVGTDAGGTVGYNFQGYQTPREIEILVESGLTPMQAIVAATRSNAEIIGVERTLGTVQPGKTADLIVLAADPLKDIANIRRVDTVIQGGAVYERDTLAYRAAPGSRP